MDFLKRNWSTLLLIGIAAVWIGVSLGTNRCPECVIRDMAKDALGIDRESDTAVTANASKHSLPSWNAVDIEGKQLSNEDLTGRVSVVMYWASYCTGCKNEIPDLVALRNEFPESEVAIVGLSVDDPHKDLLAFAHDRGINYRVARVNDSITSAFGRIDSIPTLFILDQSGQVQFKFAGHLTKDLLAERIRNLLPSGNHA